MVDYLNQYLKFGLIPIPLRGKVANYHWKEYEYNINDFNHTGVNVGLRTERLKSGLWFYVIDLDNKSLLSGLFEKHPILMAAPIVSTSKGFHIYLTWTEEVRTRHFPGVDVIGNGYVVAPPSMHPSGKPYRFITLLKKEIPLFNPKQLEVLNETPKLFSPLVQSSSSLKAELSSSDIDHGVRQGQRHNTLIHYLGILFNACVPEQVALTKALEWNKLNKPPLSEQEVKLTVRYCYEHWEEKWQQTIIRRNK
jgi:hypothetical protein